MTFYRTGHGLFHFGRSRPFGLEAAKDTLLGLARREGGLDYLRRVLGHDMTKSELAQLADVDVITELSKRVATGALTLLALRPRESRAEGFVVESGAQGAAPEQKNKAEDAKPSPIVPYEYPVLARVESDGVVSATLGLVADLASLLFGAFGREKRPSTIASAYVAAAAETSSGAALAASKVDISVGVELHPGGGLDRKKPAIPVEFVMAAKNTGARTKLSVEALAASLGDSQNGVHDKRAPAVPATFVQTAASAASGAKSSSSALGESLLALFPKERFVRTRSAPVEDG